MKKSFITSGPGHVSSLSDGHISIQTQLLSEIIRIFHECQVWIDKSVPRVTFWHHEARRVMPNCDPRDRFVYPYLTRMMDSFSCTLKCGEA